MFADDGLFYSATANTTTNEPLRRFPGRMMIDNFIFAAKFFDT
jgi:hypothetical protein